MKKLLCITNDCPSSGKSTLAEVLHDFYAEVPIDLSITGEYHNIARFFDMLATLPRIVNMGSINVKVAKDSMDATVLSVTGTATTFRFVGKESA